MKWTLWCWTEATRITIKIITVRDIACVACLCSWLAHIDQPPLKLCLFDDVVRYTTSSESKWKKLRHRIRSNPPMTEVNNLFGTLTQVVNRYMWTLLRLLPSQRLCVLTRTHIIFVSVTMIYICQSFWRFSADSDCNIFFTFISNAQIYGYSCFHRRQWILDWEIPDSIGGAVGDI